MEAYEEIYPYTVGSRWYKRSGFYYTVSRTRASGLTLRCCSRFCRVTWRINRHGQASPLRGEHNHQPTPWIESRNALFQELRMRARLETTALNRIYEQEAFRYPDGASHLLFEAVAPSMRRWRRERQPPVPSTLTEYGVALTQHPTYRSLLLATVEAGGGTAVILTMEVFARCLQDSNTIIVDGTFQTVPAGPRATQILTIHGVVQGHFYHPVIVLMTSRLRSLYDAVLRRIWQAVGDPRPDYIVTDFESGLQASLESVTGVPVSGCLFHFVQALLRRARREGLGVRFNSPGWLLVQLYGALALLPPAQVRPALAEIPGLALQNQLPFSQAFHDYFEGQWMLRVTPERFSVQGRPHRTSNVAESFHAAMLRSLGPSPNIWEFTGFILDTSHHAVVLPTNIITKVVAQKFSVSQSRLDALSRGQERRRNITGQYLARDQSRRTREGDLRMGRITLREFLWASARNMDVGIVEAEENVPQVGAEVELNMDVEDEVVLEPDMVVDELPLQAPLLPRPPSPRVELNMDAVGEVALEPEVEVDELPLQAPVLPRPPSPRIERVPQPQLPVHAVACPVCMENIPTLLIVGCGHVLCAECRERLYNCPVCRLLIIETHRIYLP